MLLIRYLFVGIVQNENFSGIATLLNCSNSDFFDNFLGDAYVAVLPFYSLSCLKHYMRLSIKNVDRTKKSHNFRAK